MAKGKSMRAAINAMCKYCIYDPLGGGGTWREQVEVCTSPECPLYDFRPISRPQGTRGKASVDPSPETAARRGHGGRFLPVG